MVLGLRRDIFSCGGAGNAPGMMHSVSPKWDEGVGPLARNVPAAEPAAGSTPAEASETTAPSLLPAGPADTAPQPPPGVLLLGVSRCIWPESRLLGHCDLPGGLFLESKGLTRGVPAGDADVALHNTGPLASAVIAEQATSATKQADAAEGAAPSAQTPAVPTGTAPPPPGWFPLGGPLHLCHDVPERCLGTADCLMVGCSEEQSAY